MKMNKIDIVKDFTQRLNKISEDFDIRIDSSFRALNKTKFFDLEKTDEIKSLQVILNIKKRIPGDLNLYESVSRKAKFGFRKFDKINSELTECFNWFSKHSNFSKWRVYRKIDKSLGEIIVTFDF
jgi:hypothetical protein